MQHFSAPVQLNVTFGETFNGATTSGCSNIAPARPGLTWFRDNRFNDTELNTTQYDAWQRFFMLKRSGKIRILIDISTLQIPQCRGERRFYPGQYIAKATLFRGSIKEIYESVSLAIYDFHPYNVMRLDESIAE